MRNVALMFTAVALMAAPAMGAWTEDFEAYSHSADLGSLSVWNVDGTTGGKVYNGQGDGDKGATMGAGSWTWGSAFKLADGGVLQAKLFVESNNQYNALKIGLSSAIATGGNGGSGRPAGPMAELRLQNGYNAQWNWRTVAETGSGENQGFDDAPAPDSWYDIRMTTNAGNGSVTYDVKSVGTGSWTTLGTLNTFAGFAPNYVWISGMRQGAVDDIISTPEPATMAMLGLGGLALIRRRKTRQ